MSKPAEFAREVENFSDTDWVEFLNELDEVSRRRRSRAPDLSKPAGNSKDQVAEWVARMHLATDTTIKEIWYLPTGSLGDEIRLIELNGRLAGTGWGLEPIEFPLDVDGTHFKLMVADTTSEEFDHARNDSSELPSGWSLVDAKRWGRGA
ncbi:MAG TPA: hypothetical protein VFE47_21175 [Tepidisphaeraceae bacterium]|jgi:hypothetical protein|nr:hypothetical protein [Tepidisphaeraceae bacterium]